MDDATDSLMLTARAVGAYLRRLLLCDVDEPRQECKREIREQGRTTEQLMAASRYLTTEECCAASMLKQKRATEACAWQSRAASHSVPRCDAP